MTALDRAAGRDDAAARELVSDGLQTVLEVARFLGVSRATVYNYMDAGELPFVKLGRSRRIPKKAAVHLAARRLSQAS